MGVALGGTADNHGEAALFHVADASYSAPRGRRALAPQLAWPLSRNDLRDALGERFEGVQISWTGWDKQGSREPLSVDWHSAWPELPGWRAGGAPTVWVRPVSRTTTEGDRALPLSDALPNLAIWLDEAWKAPDTWREARHERRWVIAANQIEVHDDDGLHILDRERGSR